MAWRKYPYLPQFSRIGSVHYSYRPSLRIKVSNKNISELFIGLVDSGTDITMMDSEVATILGIKSEGRPKGMALAVGGGKEGFIAEVTITVPEFEESITTGVMFVEKLTFDVILGQDDFFRRFLVKFEKNKNNFYLDIAR